jgi:hypothetical protein
MVVCVQGIAWVELSPLTKCVEACLVKESGEKPYDSKAHGRISREVTVTARADVPMKECTFQPVHMREWGSHEVSQCVLVPRVSDVVAVTP